jgi:hypothetical protein
VADEPLAGGAAKELLEDGFWNIENDELADPPPHQGLASAIEATNNRQRRIGSPRFTVDIAIQIRSES